MPDTLQTEIDDLRESVLFVRDITGGPTPVHLCNVIGNLAELVAVLAERLPAEAETASSSTQNVLSRIARERHRQVAQEGYTIEHDDEHDKGELAIAAACYAVYDKKARQPTWPWPCYDGEDPCNKPELRRLEISGALIVAEIERLLRKEQKEANANPVL